MAAAKPRKERLSIYLAKTSVSHNGSLLNIENANDPIDLKLEGKVALLYIKKEPTRKAPPWTKLFITNENVPPDAFGYTSAVGAALVIDQDGEKFVLTFGTGHHLLNSEAIERDFGLRVTLNSVDPDKLRSLDKASFDHNPLNSRTQSTKDVDIFDLAIDSELDILYAVTGASKIPEFGIQVTGRDALTLFLETDLNGITRILSEASKLYKKRLPNEFEWVDNISRVKDQEDIALLDLLLDDILKDEASKNIWLGEPEVIDWESQVGYSFDLYPNSPRYPVLELKHLRDHLAKTFRNFNSETLKSTAIHVNNSEFQASKTWPAYRCIYAELKEDSHQYILRNGTWYKVNDDFSKTIDGFLETISIYNHTLPTYGHDREEEYNNHVVNHDSSYVLMDKKIIKVGGSYDKLEFCDLIKDSSDLIHVKYYRSSNTLSHLFAQGFVSAETFIKDAEFRALLNPKLPSGIRLQDTQPRPNPENYKIVYAVATEKTLPSELPFFSKITLKNSVRTLRALNFQVELTSIKIDPLILTKKKFKPKGPSI